MKFMGERMMERRKFIKSLLPLGAMFSNAFGSHAVLYKGKRLLVSDPDKLQAMFKKRDFSLPKFDSDKSILDEMRRFVDMGEGHMDEIGNEVYGCEHGDGSYSVASFAPPHNHPEEYRILLKAKQA